MKKRTGFVGLFFCLYLSAGVHARANEPLTATIHTLSWLPAGTAPFATQRKWILDALKRNRFRRAESAQYLGLARKMLYNKLRQYSLNRQPQPAR